MAMEVWLLVEGKRFKISRNMRLRMLEGGGGLRVFHTFIPYLFQDFPNLFHVKLSYVLWLF